MNKIVTIEKLKLYYNDVRAIDNISFSIDEGEIFGIIGPNGAGKTSLIECMEGLRVPTEGVIKVMGRDPIKEHKYVCNNIGVQLQNTYYQDRMRVEEICKLFSIIYDKPIEYIKLLKEFELFEDRHKYVSKLSGGQQQRLSIILALIPNPQIVFFDELTTGLDPQARESMWGMIDRLRERGLTIILSTHYMEEAEKLCDRIGIIVEGKLLHVGRISSIVSKYDMPSIVSFNTSNERAVEGILAKNKNVISIKNQNGQCQIEIADCKDVNIILGILYKAGIMCEEIKVTNPGLSDVYLKIVSSEK